MRLAAYPMAFVLDSGRGSRLLQRTDRRVKPAVYFGGESRIIEVALSNAPNASCAPGATRVTDYERM